MRPRLLVVMLTAALVAVVFVPAVGASDDARSINGTLTYSVNDTGENGVVRGVYADFNLVNFEVGNINDEELGGIVVRLYDASNPNRTISQVTLREGAFSNRTEAVPPNTKSLSAPIDSVWGTFDYAADEYWTQPRNLQINGGNCERIGGAEVTIQLKDEATVSQTIEGSPRGSCDTIRR